MTLSLRKKRQTTRRNILRWMQDSLRLSVGLSCIWSYPGFCHAADAAAAKTPPANTPAVIAPSRATVDGAKISAIKLPGKSTKKTTRTANRVVRAQNGFEEPAPAARPPVVPPPAPPAPQADAIQRLRDRSAKARWDELHQEWLRARKNRGDAASPVTPAEPQPPAAESSLEPATTPANPFDDESATSKSVPEAVPVLTNDTPANEAPASEAPVSGPAGDNPVAAPGRVYLQSRQKTSPRPTVESDDQVKEKVRQLLDADTGLKTAAPVRDPAALPKITAISPNPAEWAEPAGRPVPDPDAKRYVRLGNAPYVQRAFPDFTYSFEATNVYSNPLYFEDPTLERYGHAYPPLIQPIASVARFGTQVVFLPYQIAMKPFHSKIYPLGWYAPGEYVPYRSFQPPLNAKAAAVQAGTILGVRFALP